MQEHYYVYLSVLRYIDILEQKQAVVHNAFNIVGEGSTDIIGFHVTGNYFVFGQGWNAEMLELLANEVDFTQYRSGYSFLGQRELVLALFNRSNSNWRVFKDRLVYQCLEAVQADTKPKVDIERPSLKDMPALAKLKSAYDLEEYPTRPAKSIEEFYEAAYHGIESGNLIVAKKKDKIFSMLQVIHYGDYNRPIIGSLYTVPVGRNKGYASFLVSTVTKALLKGGYEMCGLLSDSANPASNKLFLRVGYTPIYRWIHVVMD
ncbi:GNAT family N-acetyltransferase [Hymenobacter terrenus]|uniref:GNAT family N-acetyltransferase n=1 Tax=Hymenobacter terrenus TaxID=1629124 RepID=UPI0018CFA715|nr:GNAT family N-acetyltransferase [Hymenobacter terrenus]